MSSGVFALAVGAAAVLAMALMVGAAELRSDNATTDSDPAQGANANPITLDWELLDCNFVVAFAPVEPARLRPHLPEGFAPGPLLHRVTGPQPFDAGVSLVGLELDVCRQGSGLRWPVPGMTYASFWTGVIPPDALRVEGVNEYYVNWDHLIPDDDRRAVFAEAGMPARGGTITLAPPVSALAPSVMHATLDLDGVVTFAFDSVAPYDPVGGLDSRFVQWTETADGDLARWSVSYKTETFYQGTGTVRLDPASWLADLLGTTEVPALFYVGTWDYTDGTIVLPR